MTLTKEMHDSGFDYLKIFKKFSKLAVLQEGKQQV